MVIIGKKNLEINHFTEVTKQEEVKKIKRSCMRVSINPKLEPEEMKDENMVAEAMIKTEVPNVEDGNLPNTYQRGNYKIQNKRRMN